MFANKNGTNVRPPTGHGHGKAAQSSRSATNAPMPPAETLSDERGRDEGERRADELHDFDFRSPGVQPRGRPLPPSPRRPAQSTSPGHPGCADSFTCRRRDPANRGRSQCPQRRSRCQAFHQRRRRPSASASGFKVTRLKRETDCVKLTASGSSVLELAPECASASAFDTYSRATPTPL